MSKEVEALNAQFVRLAFGNLAQGGRDTATAVLRHDIHTTEPGAEIFTTFQVMNTKRSRS